MKATEFHIDSQNDAASFEKLLDQYRLKHNIVQGPLMKLGDAYSVLKSDVHDPRCFSAYLDLYLQDIALQKDISIIATEINRESQSGIAEGFFAERMSRYIATSNAAHRIRAMWDKLMGITVMLHWPDRYDEFCKSRSRLKAYKKIAESWLIPKETLLSADSEQLKQYEQWNSTWAEEIRKIVRCIEFINNNFRTAEAHFGGRIWKWAFKIQRDEDDPFVELLESANDLRNHLLQISTLIKLSNAHRQYFGKH
jgi:hypothetical protein